MTIELIIDDRTNPLHSIRTRSGRRVNKTLFLSLARPFKDSNGRWVTIDRRSEYDRRIY
jgi:hypothetical protein